MKIIEIFFFVFLEFLIFYLRSKFKDDKLVMLILNKNCIVFFKD